MISVDSWVGHDEAVTSLCLRQSWSSLSGQWSSCVVIH